MEQWVTADEVYAAKARFEGSIDGYQRPVTYSVARVELDGFGFAYVNEVGGMHQLPAAVLATVCGYVSGNATYEMDAPMLDRAIELLAPAGACDAFPHPNLWSWQPLRADSPDSARFVAVFVGDLDAPPSSEAEVELRRLLAS